MCFIAHFHVEVFQVHIGKNQAFRSVFGEIEVEGSRNLQARLYFGRNKGVSSETACVSDETHLFRTKQALNVSRSSSFKGHFGRNKPTSDRNTFLMKKREEKLK